MSKKSFISGLLVLTLLSTAMSPAWAQTDYSEDFLEITDFGIFDSSGNIAQPEEENEPEEIDEVSEQEFIEVDPVFTGDDFESFQESIISNWGGKRAYSQQRLKNIQQNLKSELEAFEQYRKDIENAENKLMPVREEVKTLSDQVNLFNEQLRFTKEKISNAELQIAERQLEMKKVMEAKKESEVKLEVSQEVVLDYIALLYDEEQQFVDLYDGGASTLKLLLAENSVSENLMGREYMAVMERAGRKVFHDLEDQFLNLQEEQAHLLLSQTKLKRLYASLEKEKKILEETRQSKKDLLAKAKEEENYYETLLEESIRQQLDSALAIQNMKDNVELIESQLALLDEKLEHEGVDPNQAPMDFSGDEIDLSQPQAFFDWPVPPLAVTAGFKDPTYPKKWGEHNAIDLRAPQFTPIKAPANGYVVEAKDNGMGYSYIILAHKQNLVTVYGHMYEILAKPGTLVQKGEVIGLSGGTPGTKGAGLQTTGPHLHFEVYHKGQPKNPLNYLPVHDLPIEYIPREYLQHQH